MEVWLWVVEQEDRARAEVRIGESVPTRAIDVKKVRWSPGLGDDVDRAAGESEVVDLIVQLLWERLEATPQVLTGWWCHSRCEDSGLLCVKSGEGANSQYFNPNETHRAREKVRPGRKPFTQPTSDLPSSRILASYNSIASALETTARTNTIS